MRMPFAQHYVHCLLCGLERKKVGYELLPSLYQEKALLFAISLLVSVKKIANIIPCVAEVHLLGGVTWWIQVGF